jgi:ubiquinone/menaquinone biosynthesis C-methylase UbiE
MKTWAPGDSRAQNWVLRESAARAYEEHVVPRLHGLWAETLLDLVTLSGQERILDVACGTGAVARRVVKRRGSGQGVVGIDINGAMLAVARELEPSVDWHEGDATQMPFASESFDVVLCQQGLQFFSDRLAGLREMHRALVPGGTLAVEVGGSIDRNPYVRSLTDALARHVSVEVASVAARICSLGSAEELEGMLEQAGFVGIEVQRRRVPAHLPVPEKSIPLVVQSLPIADVLDRLPEKTRTAFIEELGRRLNGYLGSAGLSIPFEIHYARARKPARL